MSNVDKYVTLERLQQFGLQLVTNIKNHFIQISEKTNFVGSIAAGSNDGELAITMADGTTQSTVSLEGVVTTPTYNSGTKQLTLPVKGGSSIVVTMEGGSATITPEVASQSEINNIVSEIVATAFSGTVVTIYGDDTVDVGDTITLTATTVPAGQTVTWSTTNSSVATVSNGVVSGVSAGTTTITASFVDTNSQTVSGTKTIIVNAGS